MVSFDVVSLFTAIPVDKACAYIKTKLINDNSLPDRTQLDIDDILRLLKFVLSNSYFIYNDVTYKQIHGCAMGKQRGLLSTLYKNNTGSRVCFANFVYVLRRENFRTILKFLAL